MRAHAPWLLTLVFLALLYNRLPLAAQPTEAEQTWVGRLGDHDIAAALRSETDGERLRVSAPDLERVIATWIPVEGGGLLLERGLERSGADYRSGLLTLSAGTRWQLLLAGEGADGIRHLVAVDWVRGADGVLRPAGVEPAGPGRLIGWVNDFGPPALTLALIALSAGWLLWAVRRIRRHQPQTG